MRNWVFRYAVLTGQSGLTLYVASSVVFKCLATYFRVYRRPLEVVKLASHGKHSPRIGKHAERTHIIVRSEDTCGYAVFRRCIGVRMKCLKTTSVLVEYFQYVLGKCMLSYIVCVNKRL